jgi:hypothetical protein
MRITPVPIRRVSELASGLTRNQVPRKGLWVRIPCPPLSWEAVALTWRLLFSLRANQFSDSFRCAGFVLQLDSVRRGHDQAPCSADDRELASARRCMAAWEAPSAMCVYRLHHLAIDVADPLPDNRLGDAAHQGIRNEAMPKCVMMALEAEPLEHSLKIYESHADMVERIFASSPYPSIRRLKCRFHDGETVIAGSVDSCYLKQLAQIVV